MKIFKKYKKTISIIRGGPNICTPGGVKIFLAPKGARHFSRAHALEKLFYFFSQNRMSAPNGPNLFNYFKRQKLSSESPMSNSIYFLKCTQRESHCATPQS